MSHNKKLFATLFILFVAVISSVAGSFALTNPTNIQSSANKDGDSLTLTVNFYIGAQSSGYASRIHKTWRGSHKEDAVKNLSELLTPSNVNSTITLEDEDYTFNFFRSGYVFTGWRAGDSAAGPSENGTIYRVNQGLFTATNSRGNVTLHLHAIWEPIFYEISFDANDDDATTTNTLNHLISYSAAQGDNSRGMTMPTFQGTSPRGHTFRGWTTNPNDLNAIVYGPEGAMFYGRDLFPNDTYQVQVAELGYPYVGVEVKDPMLGFADHKYLNTYYVEKTLYAVWTPNTYEVVYDMRGVGFRPSNEVHTFGFFTYLVNPDPVDGYEFGGWFDNLTQLNNPQGVPLSIVGSGNIGSGPNQHLEANRGLYFIGREYMPPTGNIITVYAKWTANTATIIFDSGGATGGHPPPGTNGDPPSITWSAGVLIGHAKVADTMI